MTGRSKISGCCQLCGERLCVTGRRIGGRLMKARSARLRDRVIGHLKQKHPDRCPKKFTRAAGFELHEVFLQEK